MTISFFLKGVAIGFSIAAPVGPIGLLCIRSSLAKGRPFGLATGLGAATADAAYGCVAAFGLTTISGFLVGHRFWLGLIGGVFLCYLGIRTVCRKPAENASKVGGDGLFSAFVSTFFLTLTNPMTILSFAAVFAGLGLANAADYRAATAMVGGVFAGSALWWLLLSHGTALFRSYLGGNWIRAVNRASGIIITAFGIYALLSLRK